jgi:hypothetical protein
MAGDNFKHNRGRFGLALEGFVKKGEMHSRRILILTSAAAAYASIGVAADLDIT